jgi:hypothetical protein
MKSNLFLIAITLLNAGMLAMSTFKIIARFRHPGPTKFFGGVDSRSSMTRPRARQHPDIAPGDNKINDGG